MSIRLVELGPFGCRIERGTAEDIENVPEGYDVRSIETCLDVITVYIEPVMRIKFKPSR